MMPSAQRAFGLALISAFFCLGSRLAAQAPDQLGTLVYRESFPVTMSGSYATSLVLDGKGQFLSLLVLHANRSTPIMRVAAAVGGRYRYERTSPTTATLELLPAEATPWLSEFRTRRLSFTDPQSGIVNTDYPGGGLGGPFTLVPMTVVGLANTSVRGTASRTRPLTLGFVVTGSHMREVLLRGVGPALTRFGVVGAAADVRIELSGENARTVFLTSNDDWEAQNNGQGLRRMDPEPGAAGAVEQLGQFVGAFPLSAGSRDAALAVTLGPGTYTVQITTTDDAAAEVLGEVYVTP